jgi:hypothetical protein
LSTLVVAVFVAVAAIVSPMVASGFNIRQQRIMKREDYVREDMVADRAAEAAKLLLERQNAVAVEVANVRKKAEETAGLLVAANAEVADKVAVVAENASAANEKLDVIHTLVNSSMTSAIQSEYDAIVRELAMMKEVVELRRAGGQLGVNESMQLAIQATEGKIEDLKQVLAERHRQDELSGAQTVKIVASQGLRADRGTQGAA